MRLLVTGGAGALGSNLIDYLAPRYEKVLVIDNFSTGKRESLHPWPNLQIVEGAVEDTSLVHREFVKFAPTHVVHGAASYKDPNDWVTDSLVNVVGTVNVVRASEALNVERFINLQTALCYGRSSNVPIPVSNPCAPFTSYGISKTAGEAFVAASTLSWVSLRLANVTGPRLAIGPIPTFYKKLKAEEPCVVAEARRDFIDVSDFLSLIESVLASDVRGYFNCSTGRAHSILEIFNLVAAHVGMSGVQPTLMVHPGIDDVTELILDPSVTEQTFGWKAEVPLEQSVTKLLSWYDRNGVADVYSHLQARR